MTDEFKQEVRKHQLTFNIELKKDRTSRLADYFDFVQEHNPLLHLVAPCTAEEFATRHVLESLTLLEYLPINATIADVGSGAGLPSIPCLLVRDDLRGIQIESKEKKADFLRLAAEHLRIDSRVTIVNKQFSETSPGGATFVTCRALDKFSDKLPSLIKWSGPRSLLFLGGENLRDALKRLQLEFTEKLMPLSERRFLFVITGR